MNATQHHEAQAIIYQPNISEPEVVALTESPTLEWLQKQVGGYIEIIPGFDIYRARSTEGIPCIALCNEEGKIHGLATNLAATTLWRLALGYNPHDTLVGPVVILCGDEEFLRSL